MLIKNALVSTPKGVVNQDVLIDEGKIVAISEHLDASNHEVIDAQGLYLLPGLIDLNVRFSNSCLNQEHIDKLSNS
jgi:dihydroorotase